MGEFVQAPAVAAELILKYAQLEGAQIPNRLYSKFRQLLSCNFANARQPFDPQRQQKRIDVLGLDDREAIRLAPVRGEFCQELVGCDAGGSSQV